MKFVLYFKSVSLSIPNFPCLLDQPTFLISDGLASYPTAVSREFRNTVHISRVGIQGEVNNNRIERFHGTVRERNKVMRAIKKPDSPIIEGQRIYYNHIRPHQALNGKTPAEACGIKVKGENKWLTLIQNATVNGKAEKTCNS